MLGPLPLVQPYRLIAIGLHRFWSFLRPPVSCLGRGLGRGPGPKVFSPAQTCDDIMPHFKGTRSSGKFALGPFWSNQGSPVVYLVPLDMFSRAAW